MATTEQPRSGPMPFSEMALRVVRGNWLGAGTTAFAVAFTAGLLGLVLALLAKPADFGLLNTLVLATVLATSAFGADLQLSVSAGGEQDLFDVSGDAAVGIFPLTVTLVACAVGVLVFRRVVRGYPSALEALGDAARAAVILGVMLALPALVLTADNDELGRGWGREASADVLGVELGASANALGALGLGALVLVTVLGLALLVRPPTLAAGTGHDRPDASAAVRWQRVRDLARPVVQGLATLVVLLPVAGLVGLLALMLGEDTGDEVSGEGLGAVVAFIVGGLANGGVWLLALGAAAPVGTRGSMTGDGTTSDYSRLWGEATQSEPGLWVAPFVLVGVLVLATWVVLRRTPRDDAPLVLGGWLASLVVVVPLLVRLASAHAGAVVESSAGGASERLVLEGVAGPEGVQTTLLVLVVASLVALAFAWRGGLLDRKRLRDLAGRAGSAVQRNPARP